MVSEPLARDHKRLGIARILDNTVRIWLYRNIYHWNVKILLLSLKRSLIDRMPFSNHSLRKIDFPSTNIYLLLNNINSCF